MATFEETTAVAASHGGPYRSYEISDLAGRYMYQFTGFAKGNNSKTYQVAGQGQFELQADGTLVGSQTTTTLRVEGLGHELMSVPYTLEGRGTLKTNGTGTATIEFTPGDERGSAMTGEFAIALAGGTDSIWIMTTGGAMKNGQPFAEMVSGEARRLL